MMARLSLRERRLVAIGILIAVLALVWLVVVAPLLAGFTLRAAEREALLERYERDERIIAQQPSVRRAAVQQRRAAALFVAPSATPLAAADALKERLGAAVTASGGELRSVEDVARSEPAEVGARLTARLSPRQLSDVLSRLQSQPPLLVFDSMIVAADQAFATSRAGPMDVRLEVSAAVPAPQQR